MQTAADSSQKDVESGTGNRTRPLGVVQLFSETTLAWRWAAARAVDDERCAMAHRDQMGGRDAGYSPIMQESS
jgi:hypothetical protein